MPLLIGLLVLHALLNLLLSREIYFWIPSVKNQMKLALLLWFVPVVGMIITWRLVKPAWFSRETSDSDGRSSLSAGLLGLDAIFNPGSAHVLDAQKRSKVTIRMEGEMYDRELPKHIELEDEQETDSRNENS